MSESHRLFLLRNRTISAFYNPDPSLPTNTSVSNQTSGESETLQCYLGNLEKCTNLVEAAPCVPGTVTNLVITSGNPGGTAPPPYISTYSLFVTFSWDPVPSATDYIITTNDTSNVQPLIIHTTGTTNATMYYNGNFNGGETTTIITVTAVTPCGNSESATTEAYPCFLAGSIVQMADNATKVIEDVKVGDRVLGAFGEINTVLALHRPLVGGALMCKINNEHSTTNHHPHISLDKKFYCGNPVLVQRGTYGRTHKVIDADGNEKDEMLLGLKPGRVQMIELGINLKTVEGSRQVNALETYSLPPETQLYNLVVSGSHTYHVDGYVVTGWPREDDFNYDTWTPLN